MTSSQLSEAIAYYELNPWGEDRADLRMAVGWSLIANINRNTAAKSTPFVPTDFMPYAERKRVAPRALWKRLTSVLDRIKRK
jgi:hypothetical protein